MAEFGRIDLKVPRVLADDGHLSWRDLAQRVGLSPISTLRWVRRLEEEHYVQGYFARFDEERLSGAISVLVSVSPEEQIDDYLVRFEERIAGASQVMSYFRMTGDADYMLQVVVKDPAAHQVFLTNTLACVPGVVGTKSAFALKSVMLRPALPL